MLSLRAPQLVRSARPLIRVNAKLGGVADANTDANAVVIDCRQAETFGDLSRLHALVQTHAKSAAFRKPGGRVAILRRGPGADSSVQAAAVSEALVGFTKSLAQENGGKGATVNSICDASPRGSADVCAAPLDWLLSHESCYVTGQELRVVTAPLADADADAATTVLVTGAARGIGRATAEYFRAAHPARRLVLVDHPSAAAALEQAAAQHGIRAATGLARVTTPCYAICALPRYAGAGGGGHGRRGRVAAGRH